MGPGSLFLVLSLIYLLSQVSTLSPPSLLFILLAGTRVCNIHETSLYNNGRIMVPTGVPHSQAFDV